MKVFEENIIQTGEVIRELCGLNPDTANINERLEEMQKSNEDSIKTVTNEISALENEVVEILREKAKKLGIND
jgi:hypothetical protein